MSSVGAALCAARISNARAEASRKNGAKSRGPKTPNGTTSKHGLRAQKYVVLPDEDAAAFQALEAALMDKLAPDGALHLTARSAGVWRAWVPAAPFGGRTDSQDRMDRQTP